MNDIMNKSMVIYLLTDAINGKQYVGQTRQTIQKRLKEHRRKHYAYIDRAIKAHGWENFTVELLEECNTLNELNERERYSGITFESVTEAAAFASVTPTFIVNVCRKPGRTAAGFHWRYLDESSGNETVRQNIIANHNRRAVLCIETGQMFSSIKEASEWAGLRSSASVAKACNDKNKTAIEFHWAYLEDSLCK